MDLNKIIENMTLKEKIGQLIQITPNYFGCEGNITGPIYQNHADEIAKYAGSILGTKDREQVELIQSKYLKESQHGIPLMFMADIIHGYEAIYPIPLALSCTWDLDLIEKLSTQAAQESAHHGIHVTFSPMLDYVNDPRWGRVMESHGEDPYLNSLIGKAMINGYQKHILSCPKHFVGYGASEAGRDYNRTNISPIDLHAKHLYPFRHIINDIEILMTSFNTIDDIPVTANKEIMIDTLRNAYQYEGVVISDWGSIGELINHKIAKDAKEASKIAIKNTTDIDMMSFMYFEALEELVIKQDIPESLIDASVYRVLKMKEKLNLFNESLPTLTQYPEDTKTLLYESASKSAVLLENKNNILPLKETNVYITGPLAKSKDILGSWHYEGKKEDFINICDFFSQKDKIDENAHTVLYVLGENDIESGEATSKLNLDIDVKDIENIKKIKNEGKKVIAIVHAGRPLILTELRKHVDALIYAWHLGHASSEALFDLIYGIRDFTGRLTMSFPYAATQIPITYNSLNTGRPQKENSQRLEYVSQYIDGPNTPLYPFGYGLSYADIELHDFKVFNDVIDEGEEIQLSFTITNNSKIETAQTVQFYMNDLIAEVSRPNKELIGFKKVELKPLETQAIDYVINFSNLKYIDKLGNKKFESGEFKIYFGFDSTTNDSLKLEYQGGKE